MAKTEKRADSGKKPLWRLLFLAYAMWMLWLLFGQRLGNGTSGALWDNMNLRPLETIRLFWNLLDHRNPALVRHAVINLVGNVIMFVPLGFFLPLIFSRLRRFMKLVLTSTLLIVSVELVQLFTRLGSCDTDDLILNLAGVILGFLLWRITAGRK